MFIIVVFLIVIPACVMLYWFVKWTFKDHSLSRTSTQIFSSVSGIAFVLTMLGLNAWLLGVFLQEAFSPQPDDWKRGFFILLLLIVVLIDLFILYRFTGNPGAPRQSVSTMGHISSNPSKCVACRGQGYLEVPLGENGGVMRVKCTSCM